VGKGQTAGSEHIGSEPLEEPQGRDQVQVREIVMKILFAIICLAAISSCSSIVDIHNLLSTKTPSLISKVPLSDGAH
jgi:hypothetical protein